MGARRIKGHRKPVAIRGTTDELAKLARVEEMTGESIGGFLHDVAETDPFDIHGACIFCRGKGEHGDGCMWVQLHAMLSGGAA